MLTDALEKKLASSDSFDEELIKENMPPELSDYLSECMRRANVSRAELIRALNVDRSYGYQLLNGTRIPTREHLLKIGLYLKLDVEDFQRLMKIAGKPTLYVKDALDAKVFYAVKHNMPYEQAAAFVWDM